MCCRRRNWRIPCLVISFAQYCTTCRVSLPHPRFPSRLPLRCTTLSPHRPPTASSDLNCIYQSPVRVGRAKPVRLYPGSVSYERVSRAGNPETYLKSHNSQKLFQDRIKIPPVPRLLLFVCVACAMQMMAVPRLSFFRVLHLHCLPARSVPEGNCRQNENKITIRIRMCDFIEPAHGEQNQ